MTENIPCILCGASDSDVLKRLSAKNQTILLRKCRQDGLVYLSPRLDAKAQKAVYEEDALRNLAYYKDTFDEDVKTFIPRLELVEKFGKPSSVLDIGSSVGTFLYCCSGRGISKLVGVEFNKSSRAYAKSRFGLNTMSALPKKGKFDLINLSDVIEHMQNPVEELKNLRKFMHKGSLLLISTPDYDNVIARLTQVKPEEHLFYFTKQTLHQALQKTGFKVLYLRNTSRIHTIKNLFGASTAKNKLFLFALKAISFLRLEKLFEAAFINRTNSDLLAIAKP